MAAASAASAAAGGGSGGGGGSWESVGDRKKEALNILLKGVHLCLCFCVVVGGVVCVCVCVCVVWVKTVVSFCVLFCLSVERVNVHPYMYTFIYYS